MDIQRFFMFPYITKIKRYLIFTLKTLLGQLIFGTSVDFINNFKGPYLHWSAKKCFDPSSKDLTSNEKIQVEEFQEKGYLILRNFFPKEVIRDIKEKILYHLEDPSSTDFFSDFANFGLKNHLDARRTLKNPQHHIPEIVSLVDHKLKNIVEGIYQSHFQLTGIEVYRNKYYQAKKINNAEGVKMQDIEILSSKLHFDNEPVSFFRCLIYFSDNIDKHNGATRIINKKLSKKIARFGYLNRRRIFYPAKKWIGEQDNLNYFEGHTGDAILFHSPKCLHSSTPLAPGKERDVVVINFLPSTHPYNDYPL